MGIEEKDEVGVGKEFGKGAGHRRLS